MAATLLNTSGRPLEQSSCTSPVTIPVLACSSPLILDRYVAVAINRLCGLGGPDTGFSLSQYYRYLELLMGGPVLGTQVRDVIGRVLFSVSKASPLGVGALNGATCL